MPNRILRDWTDSFIIDDLDVHTERFFVRLIMKVDDYGCFYADSRLLKANLFPLKPDIRETDVSRWIAACEKSGLIVTYMVANKWFLQITNFKQVLRQKNKKFPLPEDVSGECNTSAKQMLSKRQASASLNRIEVETEVETEKKVKGEKSPTHTQDEIHSFQKFQIWVEANAPRVNKMKQPLTIDQFLKVKKEYHIDVIMEVLMAMQNRGDLLKKYVSANLTLNNWCKNQKAVTREQTTEPTETRRLVRKSEVESRNSTGNIREGTT